LAQTLLYTKAFATTSREENAMGTKQTKGRTMRLADGTKTAIHIPTKAEERAEAATVEAMRRLLAQACKRYDEQKSVHIVDAAWIAQAKAALAR
jgi:uncharacterized protein YfaS (alpha-2-macroglobulin family)